MADGDSMNSKIILTFLFSLITSIGSFATSPSSMMESHIFEDLILAEETDMNSDIERMAESYCSSFRMCQAFRSATLEFLFQYESDLHPLNFEKILRAVSKYQSIPFTEVQWIDYRLLVRKSISGDDSIEFNYDELEKFKSKFCVYENLLTWSEAKYLACSKTLSFDEPVEDVESLLAFEGLGERDRTQIYMFCRVDRRFPCYMLFKDIDGNFLLNDSGEVVGQPALAYSRKKKVPTKKDGHTPSGLLMINGVMPEANKKTVFGKYRRLIVDFASNSQLEKWIPENHLGKEWWKEAQVAKEVGRKYLRVHGTGLRNGNSRSTYYPFIKTRGCIAQRENRYRDLDMNFKDQNILLNILMEAQGLEVKFENHTRIKSALYLVELSNDKSAVTRDEALSLIQ